MTTPPNERVASVSPRGEVEEVQREDAPGELYFPGPPLLGVAKMDCGRAKPDKPERDERPYHERRADAKKAGEELMKLNFRSSKEKDFRNCQKQLGMLFALVTRVVRPESSEAPNSLGAQRAMEKERQNILDQNVLDLNETYEEEEVAQHYPDAEYCEGHMILGSKN